MPSRSSAVPGKQPEDLAHVAEEPLAYEAPIQDKAGISWERQAPAWQLGRLLKSEELPSWSLALPGGTARPCGALAG